MKIELSDLAKADFDSILEYTLGRWATGLEPKS